MSRRNALGALAVLGAGAGMWAWSRTRPTEVGAPGACAGLAGGRIRWVVPHAAGGGYDAESRLIQPFLERRLGAQIAIENLPGAGGIVGARTIAAARPDARTLGIIGVPGLLAASLIGGIDAPNPAAFTVLGRIARSWHVWAAGRNSALRTIDDAIATAKTRPLVFAISEVGSVNFVSISITAALIDAPVTMVAGFDGSQAAALAAIRGDVDLVCYNFEAIRDLIAAGDLRPLLQISDRPIDPHASLAAVPLLGGPDGLRGRQAHGRTGTAERQDAMARALIEFVAAGRIVVAPPNLDASLALCLDRTLYDTLSSPDLAAAASRPLDIADAERARAEVLAAARDLPLLQAPLQDALRAMRG